MSLDDKPLQTGVYVVDAPCPRCGVIEEILVSISSVLTQPENDTGSLRVRLKGKARDHDCKQHRLTGIYEAAVNSPVDS